MKYYPEILTVLRFFAVGLVVCQLYVVYSIFAFALATGQCEQIDYGSMLLEGRNLVFGLLIYILAPLLARLATAGNTRGGCCNGQAPEAE